MAIRASDAERDRVEARLQHHYAEGRLTLPELEERVAGAYQAGTRAQLDALVADLPGAAELTARPATGTDTRLLLILLCCSPPAALVYWLVSRRAAQRSGGRSRAGGTPPAGGGEKVAR
jgi:hypothetical protein